MRQLLIIGIGSGDPQDITVKAVQALNRCNVIFLPVKRAEVAEFVEFRMDICRRYIDHDSYRIVEIVDPERDGQASDYHGAVQDWYDRRIARWEDALNQHLADGETGGFLIWGDPSIYDGTLRILDSIRARGTIEVRPDIICGISSVQTLAARHRIALNQVGGSVVITTGRELGRVWATGIDDAVVMLDSRCSFASLNDPTVIIYWGAYLGTEDEILISGTIDSCADQIKQMRAEARERKGWIFDIYLLRRPTSR